MCRNFGGVMSTETCVMYYCYLHTLIHTDLVSAVYAADKAEKREALKKGKEKKAILDHSNKVTFELRALFYWVDQQTVYYIISFKWHLLYSVHNASMSHVAMLLQDKTPCKVQQKMRIEWAPRALKIKNVLQHDVENTVRILHYSTLCLLHTVYISETPLKIC